MASRLLADCPFDDLVPRDPVLNLRYRMELRRRACRDRGLQRDLKAMIAADPLFFLNAFCWVFEPRPSPQVLPYISWRHQEPIIRTACAHLGHDDLGTEKSRGEGASWMAVLISAWKWLTVEMCAVGIVSRVGEAVYKADDPDSIFWKIDFTVERLPAWLRPEGFNWNKHRKLSENSLFNPENGATIMGYAATSDVASGGRKTFFIMDEFAKFPNNSDYDALASTQHVTNSRWFISTYKGDKGAFFDMMRGPLQSNMVKTVLDWKDNPIRRRGLYEVKEGRIKLLDDKHPLTPRQIDELRGIHLQLQSRGFRVEGTTRSPYYDRECLRAGATPKRIAEELDRDPVGSSDSYFTKDRIEAIVTKNCRRPLAEYQVWADPESLQIKLSPITNGPLKIWVPLDAREKPPPGNYVFGSDLAHGTSTTPSVLIGLSRKTGEQVLELATSNVTADRFGLLSVAICKWWYDALLNWDAWGPSGSLFGRKVIDDLDYANVYMRDAELVGPVVRKTKKAGALLKDDESKGIALTAVIMAAEDGRLTPRSEDTIREFGEFGWSNGKIIHRGSVRSEDESDKGKTHADKAIAMAVAWLAFPETPNPQNETEDPRTIDPPYGSMAWRLRERERELALADPWA